ncbi:MFS transporter [Leminorella grimontii]|uniref:MFS transporter n=1 Tax=Leminorella grimontii TaxID=82981 RepID=UPI002080FC6E|nr:multidrug resistance protein MdtM [Leminorella grimontii]
MRQVPTFFTRRTAAFLFPASLILYELAAYLTTDLIQPGIINVVRDLRADVSLAPASISMYMAGGMALQWLLGPLSDRVGRRPVLLTGALIFTLACCATLFASSMEQFLTARFIQGTSMCFIATVGYVTVQESFDKTQAIKLMALITSIVLIAPIVGPLAGAALMHIVDWRALFAIVTLMGFIAWLGLLFNMPETLPKERAPFSMTGVLRNFRDTFHNRIFRIGAATISLNYVPLMIWVAVSPAILIESGGLTPAEFAWTQTPVFGAIIIANVIVAKFIKDPSAPSFIRRAIPIQLLGLGTLIIGNLLSPHVWLWSVAGTTLYAFGIGLIFSSLFRFTLLSNELPKGTVSAALNIVVLSVSAATIEIARWLWFEAGGRLPFHLLAVVAGGLAVLFLTMLLRCVQDLSPIEKEGEGEA